MSNRREQLFNAQSKAPERTVIPATVEFKVDKKKKMIKILSPQSKMICALRKVLADMSDKSSDGCRFYIANNKIQLTSPPTTTHGKKGEAQSYRASGRCKLGVCLPSGGMTTKFVEFSINYRDVEDERGLADIEYFDPTTIDGLSKNTPIDISAIR